MHFIVVNLHLRDKTVRNLSSLFYQFKCSRTLARQSQNQCDVLFFIIKQLSPYFRFVPISNQRLCRLQLFRREKKKRAIPAILKTQKSLSPNNTRNNNNNTKITLKTKQQRKKKKTPKSKGGKVDREKKRAHTTSAGRKENPH